MHTERVSYDVITPSAARGVLEAVYWKPAIRWLIDEIVVLNAIRFDTIRRNEVASKASYTAAKSAWKGNREASPMFIAAADDRQQRNTLYLRDVDYVVRAHFELTDAAGFDDTPEKHYNIALRRLRNGQSFNHPYLGCREFPANVELLEEGSARPRSFYEGQGERDLGFMLYDLDFSDLEHPSPQFFRAVMRDGHIDVAAARGTVIG
jgi:CRISPR-associated protein Cas5d